MPPASATRALMAAGPMRGAIMSATMLPGRRPPRDEPAPLDAASKELGELLVLQVDDDGPGIEAGQRATVLARGARLDETVPGSGLGLAIVQELAGLYGGGIDLEASGLGGLRVRLRLPGA